MVRKRGRPRARGWLVRRRPNGTARKVNNGRLNRSVWKRALVSKALSGKISNYHRITKIDDELQAIKRIEIRRRILKSIGLREE